MKRIAGHLVFYLHVTLLVAICFTWVRSYLVADKLVYYQDTFHTSGSFILASGSLTLAGSYDTTSDEGPVKWYYSAEREVSNLRDLLPDQSWSFLGFSSGSDDIELGQGSMGSWYFTIPLWPILLVLFIFPFIWLFTRRREARRMTLIARGYCPDCRADLRSCYAKACPDCGAERWKMET